MLDKLIFDNSFLRSLPGDPDSSNQLRQVKDACFSTVMPKRAPSPVLVAHAREVAELLGLSEEDCKSEEFLNTVAGNRLLDGMEPFATCYGGHQFGNWAGQLGDGRAINLGEVVNAKKQRWNLQLKGAGPTPYSRNADGLAVLRSSIREFLCSEAMFHLGIPTTRALSICLTGDQVLRDMFYDGNPALEPGAVVCRVAPNFLRFGHFEILAARGEIDLLRTLTDYTIQTQFPTLTDVPGMTNEDRYVELFKAVTQLTVDMIVGWSRVGFVHGVMNTDNMSISGLTIDYGPYGWLEGFDVDWTPNTTDAQGRRYAYGNQAGIGQWNLVQLARALVLLTGDPEPFERALSGYSDQYKKLWLSMMRDKLGLFRVKKEDEELCGGLMEALKSAEIDMTIFFRALASVNPDIPPDERFERISHAYYNIESLTVDNRDLMAGWLSKYVDRISNENIVPAERVKKMHSVNPVYVLRNYLAQLAIDKSEQGDFSGVEELLNVLRNPYIDQPGKENFSEKRPEWARNRAGCSMLSCSS